jgi:hypothetical protein
MRFVSGLLGLQLATQVILSLTMLVGYKFNLIYTEHWWVWLPVAVSITVLLTGFAALILRYRVSLLPGFLATIATVGGFVYAGLWVWLRTACAMGDCLTN